VYTINASASLNNNTWTFLALNANRNAISWSINAGDAGNQGTGALSKVVDVANSVGYLGHSFGGDREFDGAMCDVRFYANANLTPVQVEGLYLRGAVATFRRLPAYNQWTPFAAVRPALTVRAYQPPTRILGVEPMYNGALYAGVAASVLVTLDRFDPLVVATIGLYYDASGVASAPRASPRRPVLCGLFGQMDESVAVVIHGCNVPFAGLVTLYANSVATPQLQAWNALPIETAPSPVTMAQYRGIRSVSPATELVAGTEVTVRVQMSFSGAVDRLTQVAVYCDARRTTREPTRCGTGSIDASGCITARCAWRDAGEF
jgi:hypothetical protein